MSSHLNHIKEEFVTARYLYASSLYERKGPMFADRDVRLINTLDYQATGLSYQMLRLAFRIAYSLFDKIAIFLNDYYNIGITERDVSFMRLWWTKPRKQILRETFSQSKNPGLFALYDIFLDFKEKWYGEYQDTRHALEHRFFRLYIYDIKDRQQGKGMLLTDFEKLTLDLLKLVHTAIMYLWIAIDMEERKKANRAKNDGKILPPLFSDVIEDEWKNL